MAAGLLPGAESGSADAVCARSALTSPALHQRAYPPYVWSAHPVSTILARCVSQRQGIHREGLILCWRLALRVASKAVGCASGVRGSILPCVLLRSPAQRQVLCMWSPRRG